MRKEELAISRGYSVTSDGTIMRKGNAISAKLNNNGYYTIRVCGKTISIHRIQAYQKYGEKLYGPGMETRHINGIRTDNSYGNITIGSHSENMMDRKESDRVASAKYASSKSKLSLPKYSKEIVLAIRNDRDSGMTYRSLMKKYGITSSGMVYRICNHEFKWPD